MLLAQLIANAGLTPCQSPARSEITNFVENFDTRFCAAVCNNTETSLMAGSLVLALVTSGIHRLCSQPH